MKMLFVDNYDSFAYNIVHLIVSAGASIDLVRADDEHLTARSLDGYDALVVGPGPGNPSEIPRALTVLREAFARRTPVFGVCLGLQAIGEALGARVIHAPRQMHGKISPIRHDATGLFAGLPSPFNATRYHSLCVEEASLPPELRVIGRSDDGVVQGIAHRDLPVAAVQFHPESILSEHGLQIVQNFLHLARPATHSPT